MTIAATLFGRDRASATLGATAAHADRLVPVQVASLGILLVAAQLPQAVYLPLWVGVLGVGLVLLRFALLRRERALRIRGEGPTRAANSAPLGGSEAAKRQAWGNHIPPWVLAAIAVAIAFLIRRQFGYFVGRSRYAVLVFEPLLAGLFAIPIVVFLPVFILFFGIGMESKIAFGATYSFFPIALNTIGGISQVDPRFITVARSMGASDAQLFRREQQGPRIRFGQGRTTTRIEQRPRHHRNRRATRHSVVLAQLQARELHRLPVC